MKKILFDSSIHLGQFCIRDEQTRIACKNSQISISAKPKREVIGVVSFNENSWSDHIIWGLERKTQDIFYKFMDVFHSVKNIDRVPLSKDDAKLAIEIAEKLRMNISNSLSCAVAIGQKAHVIHTAYSSLMTQKTRQSIKSNLGLEIVTPPQSKELRYLEKNLEDYYQGALRAFRDSRIDLVRRLRR